MFTVQAKTVVGLTKHVRFCEKKMCEISYILLVYFNASATVNIEIGELARGRSMAFVNRLPRHCAIRNTSQVNIQSMVPVNKLFICLTPAKSDYFINNLKCDDYEQKY